MSKPRTLLSWVDLVPALKRLHDHVQVNAHARQQERGLPLVRSIQVYGVPRGGAHVVKELCRVYTDVVQVATPEMADVIVDDIVDSGKTLERHARYKKPFLSLYYRPDEWLVFPWERDEDGVDHSADDIPLRLLQYIGEDVQREGLRETPARFLRAWADYTSGYKVDEAAIDAMLKTFADGAEGVDEMVLVRDIPVYSHCEHHLAPFFGVAHVAYIPNGKVLGLSKFARLVDVYARRLQVQERLTQQVAHALQRSLAPAGVGVVLECRHMCMEARGVRARGASTTTSCLLGALKTEPSARSEFMRLVR